MPSPTASCSGAHEFAIRDFGRLRKARPVAAFAALRQNREHLDDVIDTSTRYRAPACRRSLRARPSSAPDAGSIGPERARRARPSVHLSAPEPGYVRRLGGAVLPIHGCMFAPRDLASCRVSRGPVSYNPEITVLLLSRSCPDQRCVGGSPARQRCLFDEQRRDPRRLKSYS